MSDIRCTSCGGLNPQGAPWCGQCFARFGARPAPPPPPPAGFIPSAAASVGEGRSAVPQGNVTWTCASCGTTGNSYVADRCTGCGISFATSVKVAKQMDPSTTLAGLATSPAAGFGGRLTRGFRLIGVSWQALKLDPELMVFPTVAAIVSIVVAVLIASQVPGGWEGRMEDGLSKPWLWLFYFSMYLIGCLCQAAVVAAALKRFSGRDPSLSDGVEAAIGKIVPLAAWAAISCTIALLLRALEEKSKWASRLVGITWSSVTFFVIPVIVAEGAGAGKALTRSSRLFRQRWGETLLGTFGMGIAFSLLMFAAILIAVGIGMYSPLAGMIVGGAAIIAIMVVGSTLSAIFNAALYSYAVGGAAPAPFSEALLVHTFAARGLKPSFV